MHPREELETDLSNMTSRAENEENHFHRLPEELIVSIFNKAADLKCLCRCSLVSKHFAAVVSRVQTVSVTITGKATYDQEYLERINKFAMDSTGEQLHALALIDWLSLQNTMKLPSFMDKLTGLECICLDYEYPDKDGNSTSPTRKIKFYKNSAKIESFVVLESLYMHKDTENEANAVENFIPMLETFQRAKESWLQFRARYMEWIAFIIMLMKFHSSLQRVTITDYEIHGELVIGGEQGVNLEYDVVVKLLKQFSGHNVKIEMGGSVD